MAEGWFGMRTKNVHGVGAVGKVKMVLNQNITNNYTGLFQKAD